MHEFTQLVKFWLYVQGWPKELVMDCENFQNLCVVISGTIGGVGRLPFLPLSSCKPAFLPERVAGRPTHRFARSTLRRVRSGRRDSIPRSLGNVKSNEDLEAAKFTEESDLSLPNRREWQPLFIIKRSCWHLVSCFHRRDERNDLHLLN